MTTSPRRSREWTRPWVGYVLAACVSLWFGSGADAPIGIWFANALALVHFGRSEARGALPFVTVLTAAFPVLLIAGVPPLASAVLAFAHAAQVSASLWMLRVWLGPGLPPIHSPECQIQYFVLAALGIPLAFVLASVPLVAPLAGWDISATIHEFITGQLFGSAVVMPAAVTGPPLLARLRAQRAGRLAFGEAVAGLAFATCVALTTLDYPAALICLCLLVVAFVRPLDETAVIASVSGAIAVVLAFFELVPGFEGGGTISPVLRSSLAFGIVLPIFFAIVRERAALDRLARDESEAVFRRSMEDSAIGMAILDIGGRIQKANQALADMLGHPIEDLQGRMLTDFVHQDDRAHAFEQGRQAIRDRRTSARVEKRYLRKDGSLVWGQGSISAVFDRATNRATHLICHIENVDDRRCAMEAVAEAENRWNFALSSARQGVWDIDLRRNRAYHSAIWKEMLGYAETELDDAPDLWLQLVHPDDLDIAQGLDRANREGTNAYFEAEFRMRHKDGHWVWVLDRGRILERGPGGSILRAIGTHTDITRQKEAQERLAETARALQAEKDRLRVMLRSIGDAVICTDAEGRVAFMNPVAETLTGHRLETAIGVPLAGVHAPLDEDTREPIASTFRDAGAEGDAVQHRAMLVRQDGTRSFIRQVASPILSSEGEYEGTVIVFQDMSDARAVQRQLAHAASHDSLTGLANRSRFMEALQDLTQGRDDVFGEGNHMLFIDLDRFKLVNDTAGHVAGDALLKRIAATMQDCIRSSDILARLGGDEFAVILRGCRSREAEAIARLIVQAIGGLAFEWEGRVHRVGASIGIAAVVAGRDPADVVADADKGCYAAKAKGRGMVCAHRRAGDTAQLSA
ncbi:PAS domain S-box protein [Aquibium microcysteis]|uniref:PAS domain S-box protein n=1 Tax=Aquibium microcysteis TaxID=675281 RepID=UPI00165D21A6|nr:PAS domain S-box protein [Aquibium microcysteis]